MPAKAAGIRLKSRAVPSCGCDSFMLPSNRLEALKGDRRDRHSMRINDQWRVCFRFADGDVFDVEITDYH